MISLCKPKNIDVIFLQVLNCIEFNVKLTYYISLINCTN